MAVIKKLTKLGDSRCVVLPKPFLDQLNVGEHGEVEVTLERDRIVIAPHRYADDADVKTAARRVMRRHGKSLARLAR